MPAIQTVFERTQCSSPLEDMIEHKFKYAKALLKDPATRNTAIVVGAGKLASVALMAHAVKTHNPAQFAVGFAGENTFGFSYVLPIVGAAKYVKCLMNDAQKQTPKPLPPAASAPENYAPTFSFGPDTPGFTPRFFLPAPR